MRARWLGALIVVAACGGSAGPATPAADGARAYLRALQRNDPRDAYAMLSADTRHRVSYDEFARAWKDSAKERAWQAEVIARSLQGNPDVGERALVTYSDGKLVSLGREGKIWRLDNELVSRSRAQQPRDAIRLFAEAIEARDINAILNVLTTRRREGLAKQIEGFVSGIGKRTNAEIDQLGADRAELRWDQDGVRYRVVLRKENDEWRVDDLYIRPAPRDDDNERGDSPFPDEL